MRNDEIKCTGYDIVRNTQIALFESSGIDKNDFNGVIDLFAPEVLADHLGLKYYEIEEIPSDDRTMETAGLLDIDNKTIYVSMKFPVEQRRLTGMHELVHWMLHRNAGLGVMHRDRPISHLPKEGTVDRIEWEATNVACQYLMPEKMVKNKFAETFGLPYGRSLSFNDDVAFYLKADIGEIKKMDQNQKALQLAGAEYYGRHVIPLHKLFKVSKTAMAIRLQELGLIAPDQYKGKPNLRIVR